jgi:hypothetical protein
VGTQSSLRDSIVFSLSPALKRWASVSRPAGTGASNRKWAALRCGARRPSSRMALDYPYCCLCPYRCSCLAAKRPKVLLEGMAPADADVTAEYVAYRSWADDAQLGRVTWATRPSSRLWSCVSDIMTSVRSHVKRAGVYDNLIRLGTFRVCPHPLIRKVRE